MRTLSRCVPVLVLPAVLVLAPGCSGQPPRVLVPPPQAKHTPSAAYEWLDIALEATAREPTVGSRMFGVVVTCMYDAWAAYDEKAVGTELGGTLRRPAAERTAANKAKAIGHATYRALHYLFPEDEKGFARWPGRRGWTPSRRLPTPQPRWAWGAIRTSPLTRPRLSTSAREKRERRRRAGRTCVSMTCVPRRAKRSDPALLK